MDNFVTWLYATPLSQLFQTVSWIIPTIQSIHILCLAVLFTSMLMLDLRLLGIAGTRHSVESFATRFLPWLWWILPVLLATGLVMIIAEPKRDLQNAAFYIKMILLLTALAITFAFQRMRRSDPAAWERMGSQRGLAKAIGAISILLWVGIIVSGRMIAYV